MTISNHTPKRIFIIAGEASGDMLGAALLKELKARYGDALELQGIGGEKMEAEGLKSLFPMTDIAVMGFAEILPKSLSLLCRIKEACEAAVNFYPDLVITIDSPGFTFRVVKWIKKCFGISVPCIHYVAPTVWAYKPERAAKTAKLFDHLLVLLPFEARYFEAHGLKTTYVGHPVVDDLPEDYQPPRYYERGEPLHIALFPGSRQGEVDKMLPVFYQTVDLLRKHYPAVHVSIPTTRAMLPHIDTSAQDVPPALVLGKASRDKVMGEVHVALSKTGTVTLEVAKYGVPMVATYRVHPVTAWLVKRWLSIPYVNLVNIITGREVIPEMLQEDCSPEHVCGALRTLIENHEKASQQCQASRKALENMRNLNGETASKAAADIVCQYLDRV